MASSEFTRREQMDLRVHVSNWFKKCRLVFARDGLSIGDMADAAEITQTRVRDLENINAVGRLNVCGLAHYAALYGFAVRLEFVPLDSARREKWIRMPDYVERKRRPVPRQAVASDGLSAD